MNYVLFDEPVIRKNLLPFTFTRPVCEIRIGILTIREKWELFLKTNISYKTEKYLSVKYPPPAASNTRIIFINGAVCPTAQLIPEINNLQVNEALVKDDDIIAVVCDQDINLENVKQYKTKSTTLKPLIVKNVWDIFSKNADALTDDFNELTKNKKSGKVSDTNQCIGDKIFIEDGAKVECSILNSSTGPIYIGKDAEIMEGSIIRGPFALCEHAALKMGAKIYGATTIGPHSKVGGEVSNSVIFGYTNKAHDGFLGNAVLGEWCNLGADSNNSNLKNNYAPVKLFSYAKNEMVNTGLTFCGLMMGDHSKCGINTMFNTGTVVGVNSNIFGGGFPPTHIPSFAWGGAGGFTKYKLDTAFEVAERVYQRRSLPFNQIEKDILQEVFNQTTNSFAS